MSVSSILLGLVFVGRAAFVFPLSALSNWRRKSPDERITFKQQASVLSFFSLVSVRPRLHVPLCIKLQHMINR